MSRTGNCHDNAELESFFATLKAELESYGHYATRKQARAEIFEYILRIWAIKGDGSPTAVLVAIALLIMTVGLA